MLPEYSSTSNQEFDSACRVVKYNENNECSSKLPSLQDDRVKTVTFQCDSLTLSEAKHEQEYEDMSLHCKCKGIAKSCGIKSNRSKVVDFYKRMKAYYKPTKYPLIPSSDYMNASMNTCSEIHGIGINVESDIKPDSNYQGSIDYAPVLLRETSYRPNLSDCYMKLGLFQDHHKTIVQRVPKQQQSSIQSQSSDRNAQTVNGMNHDGTKKSMMKCGNEFFRIPGNKKSIGKKICQLFAH